MNCVRRISKSRRKENEMMTPMRYYPVPAETKSSVDQNAAPERATSPEARAASIDVPIKDVGHLHLHIHAELQPQPATEAPTRAARG
jgi:hypothetical protein